jgi:glycosyltransferase involved in cell wall biosynthesis
MERKTQVRLEDTCPLATLRAVYLRASGESKVAPCEIVGAAALLVNPRDVSEIANAVERVITDRALRDELRAKGIAQAAKFSWERAARETLSVYQRVAVGVTG